jgi:hypothetical protein
MERGEKMGGERYIFVEEKAVFVSEVLREVIGIHRWLILFISSTLN